jgi:site-specific DNA-cytosine methylase
MFEKGLKPHFINSSLITAQSRKRFYWTNIENIEIPEEKHLVFKDIKDESYDSSLLISDKFTPILKPDITSKKNISHRLGGFGKQGQGQRVYSMNGKSVCLSALGGGWGARTGLYLDGDTVRKPTIKELCRLQTVPENYFDNLDFTYNNITQLVGNGWTVDVINIFFKNLNLKKMNVLSLFDGMSCGQIALERAEIKINKYYSSEIDKHAIKVTQANYPDTIQLGDIKLWREWKIDWSSIDLVMGGSPCQGFSFSGKQLNFEDPRSKLFFEFAEILSNVKQHNPNVKFLLENVKMKKEYEEIINRILYEIIYNDLIFDKTKFKIIL